jgi:hypothetical protein
MQKHYHASFSMQQVGFDVELNAGKRFMLINREQLARH